VLVTVNPTRGLDFAASAAVGAALRAAAALGCAVVLISTDLDEVLALSDRVGVLYRGRLSPPLVPPVDATRWVCSWRGGRVVVVSASVSSIDRLGRVLPSLLALSGALVVSAGIVAASGHSPVEAFAALVGGALGSPDSLSKSG